jgi:hypothetical protein
MATGAAQTTGAIAPEEVREALNRILSSRHFVNAHKKKKFLSLICDFYLEGRAQELNEHLLGFDVFGRDSSFNPSSDPIVRVVAHDIRKKLEAYYKNEGANDAIRLEIPAGSYQPVFTRAASFAALVSEAEISVPPKSESDPRHWSRAGIALGVATPALLLVAMALIFYAYQLRQKVAETEALKDPTSHGAMWMPFLSDANPPLVILSNPPTLRFATPSDPESTTRDSIVLPPGSEKPFKDKFVINPEVSMKESGGPAGDNFEQANGKSKIERTRNPRLIISTDVYTGLGEAIGLHYLTDFFRRAGRDILLKQSRTLSAEDLKKHNIILLGGVWVNEWSSRLVRSEDFVFTSRATIENRNPQPGEEREYIPEFDRRSGSILFDYALITVKPNISDSNQVMTLAGAYSQGTEAAVEFVTNRNYLDQINQRLAQSGNPRYFQALLKVGVENGIPTTISILALHEVRVAEP